MAKKHQNTNDKKTSNHTKNATRTTQKTTKKNKKKKKTTKTAKTKHNYIIVNDNVKSNKNEAEEEEDE